MIAFTNVIFTSAAQDPGGFNRTSRASNPLLQIIVVKVLVHCGLAHLTLFIF